MELCTPENYLSRDASHNEYMINLGVSWREDAREASDRIRSLGTRPDWLIVDHYALDRCWELRLRHSAKKILVIDDIAEKPHDCDLLLNENPLPEIEERYKVLLPGHARLLLGPQYALLRPEFIEARNNMKPRDGEVRRILVFYGGVDPTNETGRALEAIGRLNRPDIHVDVVVGSANPHRKIIQSQIEKQPGVTLHVQLPHLAGLMAQADIALGAGGSTIWELLFLGVPALVTTTADNQMPTIQHLNENGFLVWLGSARDVGVNTIQDALAQMLAQTESLLRHSEMGRKIVDGRGVERLTKELIQI